MHTTVNIFATQSNVWMQYFHNMIFTHENIKYKIYGIYMHIIIWLFYWEETDTWIARIKAGK